MLQRSPFVRVVNVGGHSVMTDSEGYLLNLDDWSEDFARALARQEGLTLTDEHWEVIRYLRAYFERHGVQAQVREMIRHFHQKWGAGEGQQSLFACDLPARRAAETGQPPGRAAAHQGRTLT